MQGDPNQNLLIEISATQKICIFDPMFEKAKCVLEHQVFFVFLQFDQNFQNGVKNAYLDFP